MGIAGNVWGYEPPQGWNFSSTIKYMGMGYGSKPMKLPYGGIAIHSPAIFGVGYQGFDETL